MIRRFIQSEDARLARRGQVRGRLNRLVAVTRAVVVLGLVALAPGCSAGANRDRVSLPITPVISVRPRWAVATSIYVRVRSEPSIEAPITGHMRLGDVAEIKRISTTPYGSGDAVHRWYEVESGDLRGWAAGDSFELFESQTRARNAAGLFDTLGAEDSAPGEDEGAR